MSDEYHSEVIPSKIFNKHLNMLLLWAVFWVLVFGGSVWILEHILHKGMNK